MVIELKTQSLKEIINKCESLKWDINKVKIVSRLFEDITKPDEYYIKLYLKK